MPLTDTPAAGETTPGAEKAASGEVLETRAVTPGELNGAVEMPAPSERTIAAVSGETAPAAATTQQGGPRVGDLDAINRRFDPKTFLPEKDSIGRWKVRLKPNAKVGRPLGSKNRPKSTVGRDPVAPAGATAPDPAAPLESFPPGEDKYDLAAESYCRLFYFASDTVFAGKGEWQPDTDAEHAELKKTVANYLRHRQSEDLPPGWALVLAIGIYSTARIGKPNTSERIRHAMTWVRRRGARPADPLSAAMPANGAPGAPVLPFVNGSSN